MADAEAILLKSLDKIAAELNYNQPQYKIAQVSTEGANFSSFLYSATISGEGQDDFHLFAKVAAVGEKMRAVAPMKVFDVERIFYTEVLQEYRKLEEKHGVPSQYRIKVPKLYDLSPILYEETVVMENLATQGYILQDRFKSVDWEYAAAAFTEIARFHALSVAFRKEKPDHFDKLLKEFTLNTTGLDENFKPFVENAMKKAVESTREENRGKLLAFLGQFQGIENMMKFFVPGDKPMIRHGDFRPSNILHKVNKDGGVDLIPVDYQTLVCGSPVIDLFYFIFLGTDKQFREQFYEKLLDHYYTELSAAIRRLGLDPDEEYSRQTFDDEVKENLTYGLMVGFTTLALITVDSADAPRVDRDLDMNAFVHMKASDTFSDRLNGIVDDFVRWGVL